MWALLSLLVISSGRAGEDPAPPPASEAQPDEDKLLDRLVRKGKRIDERTAEAEAKLSLAHANSDPSDPDSQHQVDRAVRSLVNTRFRQVSILRQLDAWDAPEGDVRVLYATNRKRPHGPRKEGEPVRFLALDSDRIEYGVATVHIPARHPTGLLERQLELRSIETLSQEAFLVALSANIDEANARAGVKAAELLVYVHGYNNSFDYAARRAAQVAHDLDTPVVPVLFSWPSHGGEWFSSAKYTYDENAAARSSSLFADVLEELLTGTAGTPVNVFAHSMGSRVVADALIDLNRRKALRYPIDDIVLAAPDIDAAVYGRRYLDLSLTAARRVTVYCASDDRALKISRTVHGGYDRLGTCRPETISALERPGFDIIDASQLYVDILDHDKVADSPRLLSDFTALLRGIPADDPARELVDQQTHFELPP